MIIDFGQNYIAESCHCILLLEDIFMKERMAVDVQKNFRTITSLSWRLSWLMRPKPKTSMFGREETDAITCFPMMAKVFSWEQSFSHNSTIVSCLQFQTLKSFFFYEVMVVIDGNVFVYFKSEIGKIKVCDLNLKGLYPRLMFRMCFPTDSPRVYILPRWLFPLGVWTLSENKMLLWVRNQIPHHLGLLLWCLAFKGKKVYDLKLGVSI